MRRRSCCLAYTIRQWLIVNCHLLSSNQVQIPLKNLLSCRKQRHNPLTTFCLAENKGTTLNNMSTSTRPQSYSSYGALVEDKIEASSSRKHTNNKCSEWQSIFNLVSLITGCGMLTLPYAASLLGWSAVGLLFVVASVFLYAFYLIAETLESCIRTDYSERLQSLPSSSTNEVEDQKDNFDQAIKVMEDHEAFITRYW